MYVGGHPSCCGVRCLTNFPYDGAMCPSKAELVTLLQKKVKPSAGYCNESTVNIKTQATAYAALQEVGFKVHTIWTNPSHSHRTTCALLTYLPGVAKPIPVEAPATVESKAKRTVRRIKKSIERS